MDLQKRFGHIIKQYPEFVSKEQMCVICHISKKTAYRVLRSGKVPYIEAVDHLTHIYKISVSDILKYRYERECLQAADSDYIGSMREYYRILFTDYPDAVTSKDIEIMTGFSQSAVAKWLLTGKLNAIMVKQHYHIPKEYVVDFVVSPYYRLLHVKSKKQKADIGGFEKWHKEKLSR
jgi:hypothetical protein